MVDLCDFDYESWIVEGGFVDLGLFDKIGMCFVFMCFSCNGVFWCMCDDCLL